MSVPAQPIMIRWPNEEDGGYFKVSGFLVNQNVALAIFDRNLEVHIVEPSPDPNEYELKFASNPMFQVGGDLEQIQRDLSELTVLEFAQKYTHSDFYFSEQSITDPEFEAVE